MFRSNFKYLAFDDRLFILIGIPVLGLPVAADPVGIEKYGPVLGLIAMLMSPLIALANGEVWEALGSAAVFFWAGWPFIAFATYWLNSQLMSFAIRHNLNPIASHDFASSQGEEPGAGDRLANQILLPDPDRIFILLIWLTFYLLRSLRSARPRPDSVP